MEENEEKRDAYHQDDLLWGKSITDMVTRMVAATEQGQREQRTADTEVVGREASIHAVLRQTGGPKKSEEGQQPYAGRQLQSEQKPKLNEAPIAIPTPMPGTTVTPTTVKTTMPVPTR